MLEDRRIAAAAAYENSLPPSVERKEYVPPTAILRRTVNSVSKDDDGERQPCQTKDEQYARAAAAIVDAKAEVKPADDRAQEDAVFIHEGGELTAEEIERQLAVIPELPADGEITRDDIQVAIDGTDSE